MLNWTLVPVIDEISEAYRHTNLLIYTLNRQWFDFRRDKLIYGYGFIYQHCQQKPAGHDYGITYQPTYPLTSHNCFYYNYNGFFRLNHIIIIIVWFFVFCLFPVFTVSRPQNALYGEVPCTFASLTYCLFASIKIFQTHTPKTVLTLFIVTEEFEGRLTL